MQHRDTGGGIETAPGGVGQSAMGQDPFVASQVERYRGMSAEQLQELAVRLGNTPQGSIVQRVLQQKRLAPDLTKYASGGVMSASEGSPWWTRAAAREAFSESGLLHSAVAGRTDQLKVQAPAGAYVLPADVVSGLGEGNTLSGARILDQVFRTGPGGIPLPKGAQHSTIPRPPSADAIRELDRGQNVRTTSAPFARGGRAEKPVPVLMAGGEYVVSAKDIARVFGSVERGHKILDRWVVKHRKKIVKEMSALPGPVKGGEKE